MLCVEDAIDALRWMESLGGGDAVVRRVDGNLAAIAAWVERTPWVDFHAEVPETRPSTSVFLPIVAPDRAYPPPERQPALKKALSGDIGGEGASNKTNAH